MMVFPPFARFHNKKSARTLIQHPNTSGTPSGARTLDTLIKSQVLYQLS